MSDVVFTSAMFYGDADEGGEAAEVETEILDTATTEVVAPEGVDPAESGQVVATDNEQVPTYFDPKTVADQLVVLKVDGQEVEVPVAELVNGYSRTADYTRKTQELARERENLAFWQQVEKAMQVDPVKTLEYLSEQFGAKVAAQASDAYDDGGEWSDPASQKLREFQEQVAPALEYVQQQQAAQHLDNVLNQLSQRYAADGFDAQEVTKYAYERGIYSPDLLEACFKDLYFEKARAASAARDQLTTQRTAEDAARAAAAAQAATVIGNGSGVSGGGARGAVPVQTGRLSVVDAYQLAKAEHGWSFD